MRQLAIIVLALCLPWLAQAQPEEWLQTDVAEGMTGALSVKADDIDNDGDSDIVFARYSDGELWYYENGALNWEPHLVSDELSSPIALEVGDLDGDNDLDIVVISYLGLAVSWFEYSPGGWTEHSIDDDFIHGRRVTIADIDDDGNNDVVAASETVGIVWWRNTGTDWTRSSISGGGSAYGVSVADLDNDGDLDVAGTNNSNGSVSWYEQNNQSWIIHSISGGNNQPLIISCADMDNDQDVDVVVCYDAINTITWFENLNGSWSDHIITSDFPDPNDVLAVDIDNDSDMDIVSASYGGGRVAWWEQDGETWTEQTLSDEFSNAWSVDVADLDSDSDMDIISTSYWAGTVSWWEQPGIGFPVSISLQTNEWPVIIPEEGGYFLYGFRIVNSTDQLFTNAHYWNQAILPDDEITAPFNIYNITIRPFIDVLVWNFTQVVPASAPAGEYTYIARIGYATTYAEGNFTFVKEGVATSGSNSNEGWESDNAALFTGFELDAPTVLASEFELHPASPNPFNATTTLSIQLPITSELSVAVYNVSGQLVESLADGVHSAGNHVFSFDATGLASGLYFVRAAVPGYADQIQKLMLVR